MIDGLYGGSMRPWHAETLRLIGERIRKTRFARGYSMKIAHEIRARYGVKLDPSYLSRIERGKTEIPLRTLLAISDYFGLKPAFLLDSATGNNNRGTDYIFMDPQLVQYLIRLKEVLGEENAREYLQDLLSDVMKLIDNVLPQKLQIEAANPQPNVRIMPNQGLGEGESIGDRGGDKQAN